MADESHHGSEMAKVPGSSASTSSSSDGSIMNINSGTQGDVVTGVGGDYIKDVHVVGNWLKNVHIEGDLICGEKKIWPPRFVVLKANNGKFLRLTKNDDVPAGFLKFEGRDVASPQAMFELERAKNGVFGVHIRCCYNNKYLVRSGATCWIVAAADKPEENKSIISCTLFELEPVNEGGGTEFRFFHSQRQAYASFWRCWKSDGIQFHGGLCVGTDEHDAYTVVSWETLAEKMNKAVVQLPKFVAVKGMNNNKYLSLKTKNDPRLPAGFLLFEGEEVASPLAKFEIEMAKSENGLVHIRCCNNNKYLVREKTKICSCHYNDPYLIVAAADKPEEDEYKISCTLFEPEPYDVENGGLQFCFRHVQLGMGRYACMLKKTDSPFNEGLYGGSNALDRDVCDVYTVVDLNGLGSNNAYKFGKINQ